MTARFDDIIFLISTDFFANELFPDSSLEDIESVKATAREAIPEIIDGGDNYYLCADFSLARAQKTQKNFMSSLQAQKLSPKIITKIIFLYEILLGISEPLTSASNTIISIAAKIYWMHIENLKSPAPEMLIDIIATIEPLGLSQEPSEPDLEDSWLNSPSTWDKYVMSLMDGIDEAPYLTFLKVTKFSTQLNFLSAWKEALEDEQFNVLKNLIITEAHLELDAINADAAREIDPIMLSF